MKIKRLNESIKWTFDKFEEMRIIQKAYHESRVQLKEYQKDPKILKYLKEYILLYPELQEDTDIELNKKEMEVIGFKVLDRSDEYFNNYTLEPDDYLQVIYYPDYDCRVSKEDFSAWFKEKDVEDFLRFMDNPKVYKAAKKYNL